MAILLRMHTWIGILLEVDTMEGGKKKKLIFEQFLKFEWIQSWLFRIPKILKHKENQHPHVHCFPRASAKCSREQFRAEQESWLNTVLSWTISVRLAYFRGQSSRIRRNPPVLRTPPEYKLMVCNHWETSKKCPHFVPSFGVRQNPLPLREKTHNSTCKTLLILKKKMTTTRGGIINSPFLDSALSLPSTARVELEAYSFLKSYGLLSHNY